MRHWVIGGSGFTGRHLARELLQRGQRVVVADLVGDPTRVPTGAGFRQVDITRRESLGALDLEPDDVVYHLAARQYHLPVPRRSRGHWFDEVNVAGTGNLLARMQERACRRLVYFSTDMVYGFPRSLPIETGHTQVPLGPYGDSKRKSELLIARHRESGLRSTVFRPRLIVGPGRLGVLAKLFRLIERGLPVPMIGDGSNHYQMVSVHDCVAAALLAVDRGIPSRAFNLGSRDPPTVRALLQQLIERAGSRSPLVATPGFLTKSALRACDLIGLTLLHREQYAIADENYLVDIGETQRELGWTPRFGDTDMVFAAYEEYRSSRSS